MKTVKVRMKPTTLEDCLAWLAEQKRCPNQITVAPCIVFVGCPAGYAHVLVTNGDFSAAIIEAVGGVWDQVHGGSE